MSGQTEFIDDREITFDEYVERVNERLAAFKVFWDNHCEANPGNFPDKMYVVDWDEQITMFDGV